MEKKFLVLLPIIFFAGLAIAPIIDPPLPAADTTIKLPKEQKEALEGIGLVDFNIGETICDNEDCKVKIFGTVQMDREKSVLDTDVSFKSDKTNLQKDRDEAIKKRIEGIALAIIERQAREEETLLGKGKGTIEEEK